MLQLAAALSLYRSALLLEACIVFAALAECAGRAIIFIFASGTRAPMNVILAIVHRVHAAAMHVQALQVHPTGTERFELLIRSRATLCRCRTIWN